MEGVPPGQRVEAERRFVIHLGKDLESEPALEERPVRTAGEPFEAAGRDDPSAKEEPRGGPAGLPFVLREEGRAARDGAGQRVGDRRGGFREVFSKSGRAEEGAPERLLGVDRRPFEGRAPRREPRDPLRQRGPTAQLAIAERLAILLLAQVEEIGRKEPGTIGRHIPGRGEKDEAPRGGGTREPEEKALLPEGPLVGPRRKGFPGRTGNRLSLGVEEKRVGTDRTREGLLDEPRDEDGVKEKSAGGDRRKNRDAVPLEPTVSLRGEIERLGEERLESCRVDGRAGLDGFQLLDGLHAALQPLPLRSAREENVERPAEAPAPFRPGRRSSAGNRRAKDGDRGFEEVDSFSFPRPANRKPAVGIVRGLKGPIEPLARRGKVPDEAFEPGREPQFGEKGAGPRRRESGKAQIGQETEILEKIEQFADGFPRKVRRGEADEGPRGPPEGRAGEAGAGGPEVGDPPKVELGHEERFLALRVPDEDRDPVERDSVLDGAEDLADCLARFGSVRWGDDDARRQRRTGGMQRRGDAEKPLEEAAPRARGVVRLRLAVVRNEGEDRPARGDAGEEPLAKATEIVEAVDEERLGGGRKSGVGRTLEEGRRVPEPAAGLFEGGDDGGERVEMAAAIPEIRRLRKNPAEFRRSESCSPKVVRGRDNRGGERWPVANRPERGRLLRRQERLPREEPFAEGRQRRPRVASRNDLSREVDKGQEPEVRHGAELPGRPSTQVDGQEVRPDEDLDGPERVFLLEGADRLEKGGLKGREGADEEAVRGRGRGHGRESSDAPGTEGFRVIIPREWNRSGSGSRRSSSSSSTSQGSTCSGPSSDAGRRTRRTTSSATGRCRGTR